MSRNLYVKWHKHICLFQIISELRSQNNHKTLTQHKLSSIGSANSVNVVIQHKSSSLSSTKSQVFPAVLSTFSQFWGNLTSTTTSSATAPPGRTATRKRLIPNLYPGWHLSANIHSIQVQLLLSTADSSLLQVQPQKLLNKSVHNYLTSLTHN